MSTVIIGGFNLGGGNTPAVDSNGCSWITENVTGWGPTNTTLQITQKERADGGWPSAKYRTPRTVTGLSSVVGPSTAAVSASLDAFYGACDGKPLLSIDDGQGARWVTVEQQYAPIPTWTSDVACDVSWQMEAAESRKFGTLLTGTTGLPSATGGLTVPFAVPFAINSTIVSGNIVLTNPGNATGPVVVTIYGPITGPVITHVGTGASLAFGASLTLGSGEYLVVDMDNHKALAQGQSTRALYITLRGWSGFEEGPNIWSVSAVSSGVGARFDLTATPAWL
jgi:hypothetical protein